MENEFVDAELTYIVDDGKPSIRYVDWPEEKHNERLASYEARPVSYTHLRAHET